MMMATMPYSSCGTGLNGIWMRMTAMSKMSMVTDTGQRNHFCSTSGGMSMPPVEAPARMTMPIKAPTPMAAKTVFRKRSSVSTRPWSIVSARPRKMGLRMLLASVLRAKARPSTTQPQTSMTKLNASRKPETESPVRRPKASATPVAPPATRPAGSRKRATVREYPALPKTTAAALSSCRL